MATARWARLVVGTIIALSVGTASFAATGQETSTTQADASSSSQPAESTTTTQPAETTTTVATTPSTATDDGGTTTAPTSTSAAEATSPTKTAERAQEKAAAIANLNLAKSADIEIARELTRINQSANETLDKIDTAKKRIDAADAILKRTGDQLTESERRRLEIENELRVKAVEGFKTRVLGQPSPLFTKGDVNRAIRQNTLLDQASLSTTDLLEELRILQEDRQIANAEAAQAKDEAEEAEAVLQEELTVYQEQQERQLGLKAEAERRIDIWAGELAAYAREDAAVQRVIAQNAGKTPVQTQAQASAPAEEASGETQTDAPAASPSPASTSGFQWPLNARVTSEFGYRVHPIYRSRRLHAGIDIGAPSGTPIAASNAGVVIFAGTQGGYGRTVIVDHGGGITTLYAHQSKIGAGNGQAVARGDIIGYVGATGTATGNHLHFEVRVNGSPNNPRNYLP
jgi:murein DD-endopeptidase MepM/ murein hydrolase activator NlpD